MINSYFLVRIMEAIRYWNNVQIVEGKKPVFQEDYVKLFFRIKGPKTFLNK